MGEIVNTKHRGQNIFELYQNKNYPSKCDFEDIVRSFVISCAELGIYEVFFNEIPDGIFTPEQIFELKLKFYSLKETDLEMELIKLNFQSSADKTDLNLTSKAYLKQWLEKV